MGTRQAGEYILEADKSNGKHRSGQHADLEKRRAFVAVMQDATRRTER